MIKLSAFRTEAKRDYEKNLQSNGFRHHQPRRENNMERTPKHSWHQKKNNFNTPRVAGSYKPKRNVNTSKRENTCSYCNIKGHTKEKCYKGIQKEKISVAEISRSVTSDSDSSDGYQSQDNLNVLSEASQERHQERVNLKRNSENFKTNAANPHHNLPFIKYNINNKKLKLLIDSGASINVSKYNNDLHKPTKFHTKFKLSTF